VTVGRLLAVAISATFLLALVGVEAIILRSAQGHLQRQLESLSQDAATSLGLSLGVLLRGGDPALAETVINPAFDRGHYERIEYVSASSGRSSAPSRTRTSRPRLASRSAATSPLCPAPTTMATLPLRRMSGF